MPVKNKNSRYIPKAVERAVRERDRGICQQCGRRAEHMELDHITPHSKGAPATVENIQLLCRTCNLAKRNKTATCPKCNGWVSHDAKFCHHCRETIPRSSQIYGKTRSSFSLNRILGIAILLALAVYWIIKTYLPQLLR